MCAIATAEKARPIAENSLYFRAGINVMALHIFDSFSFDRKLNTKKLRFKNE